jgi:hypothetical protein
MKTCWRQQQSVEMQKLKHSKIPLQIHWNKNKKDWKKIKYVGKVGEQQVISGTASKHIKQFILWEHNLVASYEVKPSLANSLTIPLLFPCD